MRRGLKTKRTADVIVIGGGIIGCSIAFRLAQARLKVTVIDRGELGAEASGAAAGMLAPQGETVEPNPFQEICTASRDLYPRFVAEIEELSGERVGYHAAGCLLVAVDEEEGAELAKVYNAQTRLGLAIERLDGRAVRERSPGLSSQIQCGLFVPGDHWVDNERLTEALVKACRRLGVKFLTGKAVTKLSVRSGRVECVETASALAAKRNGSTSSADQFILAAGCWSSALVEPHGIVLPTRPCRGQIMEFDSATELPLVVRAGIHYLVPRTKGRILVGTTAEYVGFEKAVTGAGLRSILDGAERIAPFVKELEFRRAWAGLRPDTADHLPILGYGELPNLIFATGHFRNGILLAPVTAQLISELVLSGSTSHSIEAYRPTRFAR